VAIQLCAVRLYGRFFTLVQHFAVTIGQPTEKKAANGSAHVACTPFGIDLQGLDGLGCQF
jgi:hypothetical protein